MDQQTNEQRRPHNLSTTPQYGSITMNKILSFVLVLLLSPSVFAETPAAELEQRIDALSKAMIDADAKALRSLTAAALNYGHSSGRVEDQATFIENLVNGSSDFLTIDLQDQQISFIDDLAIVRHILTGDTNDSGKPGKVRIGVMMVWQKQQGDWKLLARQAFKI
jgi:hypothetical protein